MEACPLLGVMCEGPCGLWAQLSDLYGRYKTRSTQNRMFALLKWDVRLFVASVILLAATILPAIYYDRKREMLARSEAPNEFALFVTAARSHPARSHPPRSHTPVGHQLMQAPVLTTS